MEDDDIRSDLQEGARSEIARTVPIQHDDIVSLCASIARIPQSPDVNQPEREPTADDPPGPRFESLGSSFGNLGPLRDSFGGPPAWGEQVNVEHAVSATIF